MYHSFSVIMQARTSTFGLYIKMTYMYFIALGNGDPRLVALILPFFIHHTMNLYQICLETIKARIFNLGVKMNHEYLPTYFFTGMRGSLYKGSAVKTVKKQLAQKFNFTYRYIDDVLSLNNSNSSNSMDLAYPFELEIKCTIESNTSVAYLDCYLFLCIDNEKPFTRLYDKRDGFNILKVNFPF